MDKDKIELDHGGGGYKSWEIVKDIRDILTEKGAWTNTEDDGAVYNMGNNNLVFTADGFIVDPIFFPGGDIGKIAMCGTINDVAVMGAKPIGISLSIVIEEGFSKEDFKRIITSIGKVSRESGVPVATGDTKVTEKGKIDKIQITTSGVGIAQNIIPNNGIRPGDFIITSGDLGEHAATLLAARFNYKTDIKSDCEPMNHALLEVGQFLNACKDPTRGGLAANLVEMANKSNVKVVLGEKDLPYKRGVVSLAELLGIDVFSFASEGRFIAAVSPENVGQALEILKKYHAEAKIIGRAEEGRGVFLKTDFGSFRPIEMPKGKLIPRIC